MALRFPLYINDTQIGVFTAIRVKGSNHPDSINTYRILAYLREDPHRTQFEIEHRYGDPAWVLIRKALEVMTTTGTGAATTTNETTPSGTKPGAATEG